MNDNKHQLSDFEVRERLAAAVTALGDDRCETQIGDTAITAARHALIMLSFGVLNSDMSMVDDD